MQSGSRVGRWELRQELGRGGFAAVYRVRDGAGQEGALKLVLAGRSAGEDQRQRFQREVLSLIKLRHPGVVRVLDAGEWQQVPFLVMELLQGETLQDLLERTGPLPPERALSLARALCDALEHVHAAGLVHRDLKPENVFLRPDGSPVLVDFGLVKDVDPNRSRAELTVSGQYVGTPGYWSPEQAHGELERVGPKSDVWGLGATLYAALTGMPPHGVQATLLEALAASLRPVAPPSSLRPELPPEVDLVCARALAVEPAQRDEPAELAARIDHALARLADPARPRSRWPWLAALVLPGVAIAAALALRARPHEAARTTPTPEPRRPAPADPAPPPSRSPAALGTAAAPAPLSPLVTRALERARECEARDDVRGALQAFERAIELEPAATAARLGRARLRFARGEPKPALEDLTTLLARPEARYDVEALVLSARCRTELDDLDAALEELERALLLDPRSAPARAARAWSALVRGGADERAEVDLTVALELDPGSVAALSGRALLRQRRGDLAGARKDLERALELEPMDARARVELALLRRAAGEDPAREVEAVNRAAPGLASVHWTRGDSRFGRDDWAGAIEDIERGYLLDPDRTREIVHWVDEPSIRFEQLSYARLRLGDARGALREADAARAAAPESGGPVALIGMARHGLGETEAGLLELDRAAGMAPHSAAVRYHRGEVREAKGDLAGALEDYRASLELAEPEWRLLERAKERVARLVDSPARGGQSAPR